MRDCKEEIRYTINYLINRIIFMQELQLTNDKLKRFPPKLQELARFIEENYGFKSLREACELCGLNYKSAESMIHTHKKKGSDFNDLIYSMLDKRNRNRLTYIDNAVAEKALAGDMRAAEIFYKRTGEIKPINKTEINFNQQNNYLTMGQIDSLPILEHEEEDYYLELQD